MTPRDFVYWLQGVFEVTNPETLSAEQIKVIRDHIELVLKKETPSQLQPFCAQGSGGGISFTGGGQTLVTC